jgi:hypothetical protein
MDKRTLIENRYKNLYRTKCLKKCKNKCDLIELIIKSGNINLQDLYNLDNCKSYKRK